MGERFEVRDVLGRGGFGIAYLAYDHTRHDSAVVKELAPTGTVRRDDGRLVLEAMGEATAHRLRRRFLEEAKTLSRLNLASVPQVRALGSERGTAFFVTGYYADALSLDRLLARDGRFAEAGVLDLLFQMLETLEAVHERGILHRDVKPSNILLRDGGEALLIDFGAAREWHADLSERQTVLFTPGYAPIEQFSERGRRGPATDLYGLCATAYTLLAGFPPASAMDRVNGVTVLPLLTLRPEMDAVAAAAIEAGLALHYEERPPTAAALRARFSGEAPSGARTTLEAYDLRLLKLRSLRFGRRECPACGDLMHEPRPLPARCCPVCQKGRVRERALSPRGCPSCGAGVLRDFENVAPLAVCPLCGLGKLEGRRTKLLSKLRQFSCPQCEAELYETEDGQVRLGAAGSAGRVEVGETRSWGEWGALHPRSSVVSICDGCRAQFDHEPDGQWRKVWPKPAIGGHRRLYPEEWARVAAGLDPGAGNMVCDVCEADFFGEGESVTLLAAAEDPFQFAAENLGRLLHWEDLRWLGVGKVSAHPGLTCGGCHTEFDRDGEYWRLIRSEHRALQPWVDSLHNWADWHRLAQELPRVHEDGSAEESVQAAIVESYRAGELDFDGKGTLWRGPAERLMASGVVKGSLVVRDGELVHGPAFRKERLPIEVIEQAAVEGDQITFWLRGETQPVAYRVADIEMTVHLRSGQRSVTLRAEDLAARLRYTQAVART